MTRIEEIMVAASDYCISEGLDAGAFDAISFVRGANWADDHPKSPWKSVEQTLPEYNTPVLLHIKDDDRIVVGIMVEVDSRLRWCVFRCKGLIRIDDADRWMPIPEPNEKGGEE